MTTPAAPAIPFEFPAPPPPPPPVDAVGVVEDAPPPPFAPAPPATEYAPKFRATSPATPVSAAEQFTGFE